MNNSASVKTNNVPRHIIYGYELPESARSEFDYLDDEEFQTRHFFKYKGNYYDLNDCTGIYDNNLPADSALRGWQGYYGESYFSAVLIKYTDDNESVIVGQYFS